MAPGEREAGLSLMIEAHSTVEAIPAKGVVAPLAAIEIRADPLTVEAPVAINASRGGPEVALPTARALRRVALAAVYTPMAPLEGPACELMVKALFIEPSNIIASTAMFAVTAPTVI